MSVHAVVDWRELRIWELGVQMPPGASCKSTWLRRSLKNSFFKTFSFFPKVRGRSKSPQRQIALFYPSVLALSLTFAPCVKPHCLPPSWAVASLLRKRISIASVRILQDDPCTIAEVCAGFHT